MGTQLDLESKDCFFGEVERYVTILLVLILPMLFAGLLDTTNIQAGHLETSGVSKALTVLPWMMYAAAVEYGVLALTQRVIIVVITKMFFLLVIKVRAIKQPDATVVGGFQ